MSELGGAAKYLARFPRERNRSSDKKSRQIKKLERVLIAKVYQLERATARRDRQGLLESGRRPPSGGLARPQKTYEIMGSYLPGAALGAGRSGREPGERHRLRERQQPGAGQDVLRELPRLRSTGGAAALDEVDDPAGEERNDEDHYEAGHGSTPGA